MLHMFQMSSKHHHSATFRRTFNCKTLTEHWAVGENEVIFDSLLVPFLAVVLTNKAEIWREILYCSDKGALVHVITRI